MKLYMDLETRSLVDLPKQGVYVYAASPSTEIICWAYAIDDGVMQMYFPIFNQIFPNDLFEAIINPETIFVAHNAGFERLMLTMRGRAFIPPYVHKELVKIERWSCTAARARSCGLPGALEKTAIALRLNVKKDIVGYKLMMKMCKPKGYNIEGKPIWFGSEADFMRLALYCGIDTEVERLIDKKLPMLDKVQQDLWVCIEKINDRGILVDNVLLMKLMVLAEDAVVHLNKALREKTNGEITRVTDAGAIRRWLLSQGIDDVEDTGIGAQVVADLLEDSTLDPLIQEILCMRRDGGKSSTAKLKKIASRENADGIIRGNLIFAGAAATGRMSASGAQLQNLPRNKTIPVLQKVLTRLLEANLSIADIEREFGPPMVCCSELLRPVFIAPDDCWLARGDYGQLEARVVLWLANAYAMLDSYRQFDAGVGPDLYKVTASSALNIPIEELTGEQRQLGKLMSLSFSYGGGGKAFLRFAKIYGINDTMEKAEEYKTLWREANPEVVGFWYKLEEAAIKCLSHEEGEKFHVRPDLWFQRNAEVMVMRLPSNRRLFFWYPGIEVRMMPWGKEKECMFFYSEDGLSKQWTKQWAYGGMLTAMATQGLSTRDVIAHAILNCETRGLQPVLAVHDEVVNKVPKFMCDSKEDAAELVSIEMLKVPSWLGDCPLSVEASANRHYMKK